MERTKKVKIPDAILTADWHIRETNPVCRKDNFIGETQWKKIDFVSDLQKKYNCLVFHAGDLFDYWKPSPWLLSETIEHLPKKFYTVYGNHDLPQHNPDLANKCGIYTLDIGKHLTVPNCMGGWGLSPENWIDYGLYSIKEKTYFIWHTPVYQGKIPYPGCTDPSAAKLLRKYSQYDLIVTGDNHKPFVEQYEGRVLVNPGSLSRQTADQYNHEPRVYLWYADTNSVLPVYIPIECPCNVISKEHLEHTQERNDRIDAFVSAFNDIEGTSVSFEDNVDLFFKENQVRESVKNITYKSMEDEQ